MSLVTEFVSLLTDFKKIFAREIIYGAIGKIDKFNKQKMRADVQPLFYSTSKGVRTDHAIIPQAPVQFLYSGGFYVRPDYKKDDLVWLSYATFNIENQLKDQFESTEGATNHEHALSVVSGLALSNWQAPDEFSKDGLLIGHKDGGLWLQVTDSEINGEGTKLNWKGDLAIDGKITATDNIESDVDVVAGGKVKATDNVETDADVMASGKVKATGNVETDADVKSSGKVDANGEVTANAMSARVTLSQHTHQVTVNPGQVTTCGAGPGSTTATGTGSTQPATPGA
jgi:hypothetical protein